MTPPLKSCPYCGAPLVRNENGTLVCSVPACYWPYDAGDPLGLSDYFGM